MTTTPGRRSRRRTRVRVRTAAGGDRASRPAVQLGPRRFHPDDPRRESRLHPSPTTGPWVDRNYRLQLGNGVCERACSGRRRGADARRLLRRRRAPATSALPLDLERVPRGRRDRGAVTVRSSSHHSGENGREARRASAHGADGGQTRATTGPCDGQRSPGEVGPYRPGDGRAERAVRARVVRDQVGDVAGAARRRPTRPRRRATILGIRDGQRFTRAARRASCAARRRRTRPACGRSRSASRAARRELLVLLRQQGAVPEADAAASSTRSRSARRATGATCCRRACRAAATCSTPTRSTARSTAARSPGGVPRPMRRLVVIAARRVAAVPAPASAAEVELMVVGKQRRAARGRPTCG